MRRAWAAALLVLTAPFPRVGAATVPVLFTEGVTRGFLVVRDARGATVAHGDLLQSVRAAELDKRMTLNFIDGSVLDEQVTFTQQGVYALKSYRLSEKGPTFDTDTEIAFTTATGAYRVSRKDHKGGQAKTDEGTIELPADVYNGLLMTVVKDLPHDAGAVVHYVAFVPQPKLIEIELVPRADREEIRVGDLTRQAIHFVLKPKLGAWLRFFATILRRVPPDLHVWILPDGLPTFVAFEGVVGTTDDVWTIEAISPTRGR